MTFVSASLFAASAAVAAPKYDHIVIVVEENHGYSQVVGPTANAPYLNSLINGGVLIANAYGEQHPSQPNYFWLFSGSNQGIVSDTPYWTGANGGPVFTTDNLYTALQNAASHSQLPSTNFFGGYVDSGIPGTPVLAPTTTYYQNTTNYVNRHVPWLGFANINNGNPAGITKDFGSDFPTSKTGYSQLPVVSFVIPALNHDMHDYNNTGGEVSNSTESSTAITNADTWLKKHLSGYAKWAKTHNSLLIVTWDEDSTADWTTPPNASMNPLGLTAPNLSFNASSTTSGNSGPNQIAMIFYGAHLIKTDTPYTVPDVIGVNNINLLRTIESIYGLSPSGAQTPLATNAGMSNGPITGIFVEPK